MEKLCKDNFAGFYTFDSPKVENRNFTSYYNKKLHRKSFRFINYLDPVARYAIKNAAHVALGLQLYRGIQSGRDAYFCQYSEKINTFRIDENNEDENN